MKKIAVSVLLMALAGAGSASAQLVIDDFSTYTNTTELQQHWNSFGAAATAGAPTLNTTAGVDGSHAALYRLDWGAGNNGNMRMTGVPAAATNLSAFAEVKVTLRLEPRDGYNAPTNPTLMRLGIESLAGGSSTVWQTNTAYAVTPSVSGYATVTFKLDGTEMGLVSGSASLAETLADIANIRLRFENTTEAGARQDVFISSIVAYPAIPETSTYSLVTGLGVAGAVVLFRRRRSAAGK